MQISLNGKPFETIQSNSIEELLVELKIKGRIAVEINGKIITRSQYNTHKLNPGDTVEIVHAIGGG